MIRGGFRVESLCKQCNNGLGSKYASHYVDFVRGIVSASGVFDCSGRAKWLPVHADTLLLAKQLALMILAFEPMSFSDKYLRLRRFVLDEKTGIDLPFRVWGFLVPDLPAAGTLTRSHARADLGLGAKEFCMLGGEISLFPFGFVYAWELGSGYQLDKLTEITHWFRQTKKSERLRQSICLYERLTGIDSIGCSVGSGRSLPQADFL